MKCASESLANGQAASPRVDGQSTEPPNARKNIAALALRTVLCMLNGRAVSPSAATLHHQRLANNRQPYVDPFKSGTSDGRFCPICSNASSLRRSVPSSLLRTLRATSSHRKACESVSSTPSYDLIHHRVGTSLANYSSLRRIGHGLHNQQAFVCLLGVRLWSYEPRARLWEPSDP